MKFGRSDLRNAKYRSRSTCESLQRFPSQIALGFVTIYGRSLVRSAIFYRSAVLLVLLLYCRFIFNLTSIRVANVTELNCSYLLCWGIFLTKGLSNAFRRSSLLKKVTWIPFTGSRWFRFAENLFTRNMCIYKAIYANSTKNTSISCGPYLGKWSFTIIFDDIVARLNESVI